MMHLQYRGGFHASLGAPLIGDGDDIIELALVLFPDTRYCVDEESGEIFWSIAPKNL